MKLIPILFLLVFSLAIFHSCGGSGGYGSDDDDSAQNEEAPGEEESVCVSPTNRSNIESVLNEMDELERVEGTYKGTEVFEDGSESVFDGAGAYVIDEQSEDSWQISGGFCDDDVSCLDTAIFAEFRNDGCFYANDKKVDVVSTSSTQFTYSVVNDVDNREQVSFSVSADGELRSTELIFDDNNTEISNFVFEPL